MSDRARAGTRRLVLVAGLVCAALAAAYYAGFFVARRYLLGKHERDPRGFAEAYQWFYAPLRWLHTPGTIHGGEVLVNFCIMNEMDTSLEIVDDANHILVHVPKAALPANFVRELDFRECTVRKSLMVWKRACTDCGWTYRDGWTYDVITVGAQTVKPAH